ncbi:MAG: hypothetical protein ACOCZR_00815 [Halanaerobiales bacterium]
MEVVQGNKIDWGLNMSLSGGKGHSLLYRGEFQGRGVQLEIHTSKHKTTGKFLTEKRFWSIDGDERLFEDRESFIEALKNIKEENNE